VWSPGGRATQQQKGPHVRQSSGAAELLWGGAVHDAVKGETRGVPTRNA
jgi:hypothetical protein